MTQVEVTWPQVFAIIGGFAAFTVVHAKLVVPMILNTVMKEVHVALEKSEARLQAEMDRRFRDRTQMGPFHIGDRG